jgi:thymidylate synthase
MAMNNYYELLEDILKNGKESDDRTGVGTLSVFGRQLRYDLNDGFPLLTGKHTSFRLIAAELLWFLSGSTDNEDLRRLNGDDRPTIWEEWQNERGGLGRIYGHQWRFWNEGQYTAPIDQIAELIEGIIERPHSRRHVVSAWNASDLPCEDASPKENASVGLMSLAPCHYSFQMNVQDDKLSCLVNIRSSDTFLGLPFNIASYALLTHMIAKVTNLGVGELIVSLGNAHIYKNHIDQVKELLSRDRDTYPLPTLFLNANITDIDDFNMTDMMIVDYKSHPAIKAPVAI